MWGVSVHNQLAPRQGAIAEGKVHGGRRQQKQQQKGRNMREGFFCPLYCMRATNPKADIALTLIIPALDHESISNSRSPRHGCMRLWRDKNCNRYKYMTPLNSFFILFPSHPLFYLLINLIS